MELTQHELNRNRLISGGATLLIMALLLLFLILFQLITPNPPFPESGGGGGQELALGMVDLGNDNVDYNAMGAASNVVTEEESENIQTVENGEEVLLEQKPEIKETPKVTTQVVKPQVVIKEKTAAEKLAEKFKKNTGKTGGGIGDNQEAGQSGSPDGDPFKNGTGGTGSGSGGGDSDGDGSGSGPGKGPGFGGGKYNVNLKGRALVKPPKLPTDLAEEGKVVVEITVDSEGTVIEANPNGRGTTTSSAMLKAKAKQAALATKFNVDGKFEEQKGTITIIFTFN
ncbi:MAG: hypothetical protein MUF75_03780 [Bacteroidia bacterium]|nr:hypothetical protein [Bacteroidia bacterium]